MGQPQSGTRTWQPDVQQVAFVWSLDSDPANGRAVRPIRAPDDGLPACPDGTRSVLTGQGRPRRGSPG